MSTSKTFFITGASQGMGLALARAAAARGDNVVALARRVEALDPLVEEHGDRVLALAVDVRRPAEVEDAVTQAVEAFGRIDVVHNNAGFGVFGAVEEATDEQARAIFDTNVFGVLNVLRATLPVLRAQRSGHILQGSSFYGRYAHPGVGMLAATKYAVEGLTEAMVGEVEPLGIKLTLVEPGPTRTGFGDNGQATESIGDYEQSVHQLLADAATTPPEAYDPPDQVAAAVLVAVDAERPPLRLLTGSTGLNLVRDTLHAQLEELEAWRATSEAVDGVRTAA